jgi:geranylgeranyl diphosphate synthase type I
MQKLKEEIEAYFVRHLEEHPFWTALATESPAAFNAVRATLLAPGKRLRPLLFCMACRTAGREPVPDLMPVALALELAHSFILVHDDIIDRSDERRGAPTLPKRMNDLFAEKSADGFHGSDFALVTGDLLYTLAIESLLLAEATDSQKTEAVRLFMQAALATGRGALLEMRAAQTPLDQLTVEAIEEIYALKTGHYTFTLPLQLAAVFSNDWKKTALRNSDIPIIGKHAGIAYQLLNDLNDPGDDLRDDRRTWALVYAGLQDKLKDSGVKTAIEEAQRKHLQLASNLTLDPVLIKMLNDVLYRKQDTLDKTL